MADRVGTSRLLLVEGVPGLGKSTTVEGVVRRYVAATPPERLRTVVALAQTHTYGPLAARETLLGARLLLIDGTDETIRQRTVLARAATEFIVGYALGRFGATHDELAAHFVGERDRFRVLFERSTMIKRVLRAEQACEDIVASALDFWLDPRDTAV